MLCWACNTGCFQGYRGTSNQLYNMPGTAVHTIDAEKRSDKNKNVKNIFKTLKN